ncbi:competence protein ComEA helix-hairpin-helix repeat region [Longilinea arvoryzae]|uniref:Competence protein ComEA helix-hairpin-helix repeat region n=1 Tax=Longilinea arvoryzae TaxID=360412 RepID=A0A0S7BLZ5_9CHLR|nr:helix-hairpin-helix domain-containing protein [Longilinea arvoryzae]GAP14714.1 competence protein ComEA helix-hairpin-helix repeat region [Longilinea arvoryzae]
MKPWQLVAFGLVLGLLAAAIILLVILRPIGQPIAILPAPTLSPIMVDVSGEVLNPGVYTLQPDSRVMEAVAAAGGLLDGADVSRVNLAGRVQDGDKVWIPAKGAAAGETTQLPSRSSNIAINLNTATAQELETLPGIGEVKASQIVAYREEHGLFMNLDDLLNVPGIGPELLEKIRPEITLSN